MLYQIYTIFNVCFRFVMSCLQQYQLVRIVIKLPQIYTTLVLIKYGFLTGRKMSSVSTQHSWCAPSTDYTATAPHTNRVNDTSIYCVTLSVYNFVISLLLRRRFTIVCSGSTNDVLVCKVTHGSWQSRACAIQALRPRSFASVFEGIARALGEYRKGRAMPYTTHSQHSVLHSKNRKY